MLSFKTSPAANVSNTPRPQQYTSPADEVASNDDLLTQILIHLPAKSLVRFKSVSKHWLSLITSSHLSQRRYPHPSTPSGLFMCPLFRTSIYHPRPCTCSGQPPHPFNQHVPEVDFIPIDNHENLTDAPYFPGLSGVKILDSCNGLLCCSSSSRIECGENYHVYNPTTKQFITLPEPGQGVQGVRRNINGLNLAFDPSKSPHYKVVCVWRTVLSNGQHFQIEIYSSETKRWQKYGEPFITNGHFCDGAYWNGAINWITLWGDSSYFNVDHNQFGTIPMLPDHDVSIEPMVYLGESNDHLHLIEIYFMTQFDVYELKRDYSEWFVKYRVDLEGVVSAFPETILDDDLANCAAFILSLVRGERDEESFLVLHIPGKVLRYNIVDKTFKKLCDVSPRCEVEVKSSLRHIMFYAFQYIESLIYV